MRADESSKNEIGLLSKSFNKMLSKISGILTKITTFTDGVVQSSGYLKNIEENVDSINRAVREQPQISKISLRDSAGISRTRLSI